MAGEAMSLIVIAQALTEIRDELEGIKKALNGGSEETVSLGDLQKEENDDN